MNNIAYYFIFENEYMNDIIDKLSIIFDVSPKESSVVYKDDLEQVYLLDVPNKGVACILANSSTYTYALYIFAEVQLKKELEEMLTELCDEIEEDYGDDRRALINNITLDSSVVLDCIKTAQKFGYYNLLERYINA